MTSTCYLDVTFSSSVTILEGCIGDISNNFRLENVTKSETISIESSTIVSGKVRLLIDQNKVPQKTDKLNLFYTDNSGNNGCHLVDSATGYVVTDLGVTQSQAKEQTAGTRLPSITSAIIDDSETKQIKLTFTKGRNVEQISIKGTAPNYYGIQVNKTDSNKNIGVNNNYTHPVWSINDGTWTLTLKAVNDYQFQSGQTITLDTAVANQIADQFDLSMADITNFPVQNKIKQIVLDSAFIVNNEPDTVLLYFKKEGESDLVDIDGSYDNYNKTYKVIMNNGGVNQTIVDISGVSEVKYDATQLLTRGITDTKYIDKQAVKFNLDAYPFKYGDDVKVLWTYSSDTEPKMTLGTTHIVFDSYWDPNAVKTIGATDISSIRITQNMINGITVNKNNLAVNVNTNNISYDCVLHFVTQSNGTSITGQLYSATVNDFTIHNLTTDKRFTVDSVAEDGGNVKLTVNYNENNFDKIINKGDSIKFEYTPGETKWPTTIRDTNKNYMFDNSGNGFNITNNIDFSGNIASQKITSGQFNKLVVDYTVDICLNYIDKSNFINNKDNFVLNVDLPSDVVINSIEKGSGTNNIILILNKELYGSSIATLSYTNVDSVIRNKYGIKLNNESNLSVNVSVIPAPGDISKTLSNTGKYNEYGVLFLDLSNNITSLGDKKGWVFKTEYDTGSNNPASLIKDWTSIPANNIDISGSGDNLQVRFNLDFNDAGGIRGFGKNHKVFIGYRPTEYQSESRAIGSLGFLPEFDDISMNTTQNKILSPFTSKLAPVINSITVQNSQDTVPYSAGGGSYIHGSTIYFNEGYKNNPTDLGEQLGADGSQYWYTASNIYIISATDPTGNDLKPLIPVEHIWTAVWDPAERGGAGAYTYSTSGTKPKVEYKMSLDGSLKLLPPVLRKYNEYPWNATSSSSSNHWTKNPAYLESNTLRGNNSVFEWVYPTVANTIPKDSVFVFSNTDPETVPKKLNSVVFQNEPNKLYIPVQTKTTTDNTIYDISNILINGETGNSFVIKSHNSGNDVSANSISIEEGKFIDSNSNLTANTKWIGVTFPVDISKNTLNSNDHTFKYVKDATNSIIDQNGSVWNDISDKYYPVRYNQTTWIDLSSNNDTNNGACKFETGYPHFGTDSSKNNIYIQWDPPFTDFAGTTSMAFKVQYTDVNGTQVATSDNLNWEAGSGENRLIIGFDNDINVDGHTNFKLSYIKPVGNGGMKIGDKWLNSFGFSNLTDISQS